jgi:hypothetical protein
LNVRLGGFQDRTGRFGEERSFYLLEFHVPTVFNPGRASNTRRMGGWEGFRTGLDVSEKRFLFPCLNFTSQPFLTREEPPIHVEWEAGRVPGRA